MNTQTGPLSFGNQLRTSTFSNTIKGTAQTNFYIGSNNIVRAVQGLQNYRF